MLKKWLSFGKKVQRLEDTAAGKAWLDSLHRTLRVPHPVTALQQSLVWFSDEQFDGLNPEHLEEAGIQGMALMLSKGIEVRDLYLAPGSSMFAQENIRVLMCRTWSTLNLFLNRILDRLDGKVSESVLLLQGVRILTEWKTWNRLHYQSPTLEWWTSLDRFSKIAKANHLEKVTDLTFEGDTFKMNVSLQVRLALVMESLPAGSLSLHQIVAAEAILYKMAPVLEKKPDRPSHFWMPGDCGISKVFEGKSIPPEAIVWGSSPMHLALAPLKMAVHVQVPEWLKKTGIVESAIPGLFQTLALHWSDRPPERRHPREIRNVPLFGVVTLEHVIRAIVHSQMARHGLSGKINPLMHEPVDMLMDKFCFQNLDESVREILEMGFSVLVDRRDHQGQRVQIQEMEEFLTDLRASSLPIHGEVREKLEIDLGLCRSADGAEGLRSWGLRPQKHNPPNKMSPLSSGLRGYCHSAPMGYVLRSSLSEMSLETSERRVALTVSGMEKLSRDHAVSKSVQDRIHAMVEKYFQHRETDIAKWESLRSQVLQALQNWKAEYPYNWVEMDPSYLQSPEQFLWDSTFMAPGTSNPRHIQAALESYDFLLKVENWNLQDVSESGIGVTVPGPWLENFPGSLIGFRYPDEVIWKLGVIRRIEDHQREHFYGIEVIPGEWTVGRMKKSNGTAWEGNKEELSVLVHRSSHIRVLLPRAYLQTEGEFLDVDLYDEKQHEKLHLQMIPDHSLESLAMMASR